MGVAVVQAKQQPTSQNTRTLTKALSMPKEHHKVHAMPLRLEPKLRAAVAKMAKARGCSSSQLIRDAITKWLDICPSCGQAHKAPRKGAA